MAASLCEPSELKMTIGSMELAWCKKLIKSFYIKNIILGIGIAIGPICASFFFYIGGYVLPFLVCGLTIFLCIPLLNNLDLAEDEEGEVPQFMTALMDFVKK